MVEETYGIAPHIFIAIVAATVIVSCCGIWVAREWLRQVKQQTMTNVKIVLGLAQVVSLLGPVLDLLFPPEPQQVLSLFGLLTLDIHNVLELECWTTLDYYQRWLVTVVFFPTLLLGAVGIRWFLRRYGDRGQDRAAERKEAMSHAFFVVMLLYP